MECSMSRETIRTTCPRDCYDACGIQVVRNDGRIIRVGGDPDHPISRGWLCPKCAAGYNGSWRDPAKRLNTPLRRSGRKPAGSFVPVPWDEALDEIADRLRQVSDTAGADKILTTHYSGTMSLIAFHFPMRFFNRLGATDVDPDSICNKAGHVALKYVYGTSTEGFDPRTVSDSRCILVWGANPSVSAPHAHQQWLKEAPGAVIVVDPIRTETAAAADLHLQPFPGTDGALAFALMHVLRRDGLIDRDFLQARTIGWDELEPLLEPCTAEWGERATGVPAALIERAARLYGEGPSLLWLGQGFQRQRRGGNALRACSLLPALTGNVGRAGAGFLYLNWVASRGIDEGYLIGSNLATHSPPAISQMDLAAYLENPARSQALVCWSNNIAASNPQQVRLRRALEREDLFTVVIDLFPTDTSDFADIVLPAASFLEFDDVVISYFNQSIAAQARAMPPMGDSLPNQEIFRRLAARMGFRESELFESDAEMIATILGQAGVAGGWEALAAAGTIYPSAEPVIQFAKLEFPTPSGKIEIASALAEEQGLPRLPEPIAEPRPGPGRLRLITAAGPWSLNDSFSNDPRVARHMGQAVVTINPVDAAAQGLSPGDEVVIRNSIGSLTMALAVSDLVPPGVASSPKGRWPKLERNQANVNFVNGGEVADMGGSTAVHGTEIVLEPVRKNG
jgi:anaerobic selenocysteine-containing dehydrogenase